LSIDGKSESPARLICARSAHSSILSSNFVRRRVSTSGIGWDGFEDIPAARSQHGCAATKGRFDASKMLKNEARQDNVHRRGLLIVEKSDAEKSMRPAQWVARATEIMSDEISMPIWRMYGKKELTRSI